MRYWIVFILSLLTICSQLFAQPNLRFQRIDPQKGLSQASVNALWQDKQGFMWIGTQDGLNRYDGYGFKVYHHNPEDPGSISSNWVADMYEDDEGILWLATFAGLNRFDKKTEQFTRYSYDSSNLNSLSHDITTAIVEDNEGMLWIGTHSGLNRFDRKKGHFTRYHYDPNNPDSLGHDWITAISVDRQGRLWVGTRNGGLSIYDYKSQTFSRYQSGPDIDTGHVTSLLTDQKGLLWIGTNNHGLFRLNEQTGDFQHYQYDPNDKTSLSNNRVLSLLQDSKGALWVGTNEGLNRYQPEQNHFLRLQHDPAILDSLADNSVNILYEDNTGVIWVGMVAGLSLFNHTTEHFGHYNSALSQANSMNDNTVWSVMKDNAGIIWIATDEGLNRFDRQNNRFNHYDRQKNFSSRRVLVVRQNSQSEHWVGTFADGTYLLDDKTGQKTFYRHDPNNPQSISDNRVDAIIEDKQNVMWFGTNNGLNRFDRQQQTFKHYHHDPSDPNSLSSNQVLSLYVDHLGVLWVGTRYGGLNRYHADTDTFTRYQHTDSSSSISHNRIYSITQDREYNLWIGTKNGLNRFDAKNNRFIRYQEKQGLINNTVYGIQADNQGALWLSSNKGLSRFNLNSHSFRHFTVNEGLQGREYNAGATFKSDDGELFFGGTNGFNAFYPKDIVDARRSPKTIVTDLLLFNQSVPLQREDPNSPLTVTISQTKTLTLTHNSPVFAFEFAAIDFFNSSDTRYGYRLFGYDEQWLQTDARNRRATYTNLPAGKYYFKVRAARQNEVWGQATSGISVIVKPAPWRTWWAYTSYTLVMLICMGVIGYQRNQKRLKREEHYLLTEKNKEQLQLALWGSGDQLWDIDLVTNRIKRKNLLTEVNYPKEAVWQLPEKNDQFYHPDDKSLIEKQVMDHFEKQTEHCEITYRVRNKAGEWIWLLDRGQVVEWDEEGSPLRFSGTTRNVHHLKSTEAKLLALTQSLEQRVEQRTKELVRSNEYLKSTQSQLVESEKMASLGGVVAGVSHEINTPVGIAITALSSLKERSKTLFNQAALGKMTRANFTHFQSQSDSSLRLALESLNKASMLVENFKQIAVDRSHERQSEVELDQLIQDVISASTLHAVINKEGITLDCPTHLMFTTYPDAFAKIFFELVQNTLVHGYSSDEPVQISIAVSQHGNEIHIIYRDCGRGMDDKTLERIFDPFYTTNRTDGSGLGMHVVYNQVTQLLKGKISCQSQLGLGCRFIICLPML